MTLNSEQHPEFFEKIRLIVREELAIALKLSLGEYLSVEETAKFLKITPTYVYELTSKIRNSKPSGQLYFKRSDLIDYIESGMRDPVVKNKPNVTHSDIPTLRFSNRKKGKSN